MHRFTIGRLSGDRSIPSPLIESMYRLRYRVFHERLSWEVKIQEGREFDEFDDLEAVYVIGTNGQTGEVDAAWRLRPTTRPYMLKDTFAQLLDRPAPESSTVWEVSRFAVVNTPYADSGACGFGDLTRNLVAHTVLHGVSEGISSFVWVTSLGVERMARRLGYRVERWGAPRMIGKVNCVVNNIPVTTHSIALAMYQLGLDQLVREAA